MWDESKNEFARKLFWGGGNGWTAADIAKILNVLPKEKAELRNKMISYGKEVIEGCMV